MERAVVEQVLDPLAGQHLAAVVLAVDRALGAGVERLLLALRSSSRRSRMGWSFTAAIVAHGDSARRSPAGPVTGRCVRAGDPPARRPGEARRSGLASRSAMAASAGRGPVQRQLVDGRRPRQSVRRVASVPEEQRPLALGRRGSRPAAGAAHVDVPVGARRGDRPRCARSGRSTAAADFSPHPGRPGKPSALSPTSASQSGIDAGGTPNFSSHARLVEHAPWRRSNCTTLPPTHWARSLSGVQISTCSTRSSAAATRGGRRQGVVGLELDHRARRPRRAPRAPPRAAGTGTSSSGSMPAPSL